MPYIERKTYTKDQGVIRWEKYYCYLFRPEGIPLQELRAKKEKESPDDLKRRNARRRESNIAMRIANNFKEGDAYLTMTYDAEHLPQGEERKERVEKDLRNLLGRIGRRYKKEGQEFRYVTTPENVAPGKKGRPHIHILLPALQVATTDRELERLFGKIWGKGRVHVRQCGGETRFLLRQRRQVGGRRENPLLKELRNAEAAEENHPPRRLLLAGCPRAQRLSPRQGTDLSGIHARRLSVPDCYAGKAAGKGRTGKPPLHDG